MINSTRLIHTAINEVDEDALSKDDDEHGNKRGTERYKDGEATHKATSSTRHKQECGLLCGSSRVLLNVDHCGRQHGER